MVKKQRDFLRLRHAKQYDEGTRKNPFFFKAPPRRWVIGIGFALGLVGVLTGFIALTYLPWFRISGIEVSGLTTISSDDLKTATQQEVEQQGRPFVAPDNVYLVDRQIIAQRLVERFSLEYATVNRSGTQLQVVVKERVMNAALRNKEKTVFINLDGTYLREASIEESRAIDVRLEPSALQPSEVIVPLQPDMPIILNTGNDAATSIPENSAQHILALQKAFQGRGIQVKTFTIDGSTALWTRIDTDQPYDLLCDLEKSVDSQLTALQSVLTTPGFTSPNEYIDLRFGAYVYMK